MRGGGMDAGSTWQLSIDIHGCGHKQGPNGVRLSAPGFVVIRGVQVVND
jgi:hypothetical protein